MNLVNEITRFLTQYRAFRTTVAELERCSDRELADLGIDRIDITRVAYEAAERQADGTSVKKSRSRSTGLSPAFAGRS